MEAEGQTQPQQLEQVRRNIEHWRQTRVKLGAMPASLWEEAAAAARAVGTHRVSQALGLNYLVLRQHAFPKARAETKGPRRAAVRSKKSGATFIEVQDIAAASRPPTAAVNESAVVEVVAADGARLIIRLKGGSPDLAALVASFR